MPSKSSIAAGVVAGTLLAVILFFLLRPQIYIRIGLSEYEKAGRISEELSMLYAERPDGNGAVASTESKEYFNRGERLRSKMIKHYERAIRALGWAKKLKSGALNDEALIALADSRIAAFGRGHPLGRHTIPEVRQAMMIAKTELEEAIRINEKSKDAYSFLIQAKLQHSDPPQSCRCRRGLRAIRKGISA